ncbi:hypothetical protein FS749_016121 [Ceratobasidium sp. UAMH 11750]|nr:hypothetical protein FS749_016121 [Ceratobasidium sp. UAMH 11750]
MEEGDVHTNPALFEPRQASIGGTSVTSSPDDRRNVSSSDDATVQISDAPIPKRLVSPLLDHSNTATPDAASPDDQTVSGFKDKIVQVQGAQTDVAPLKSLQGLSSTVEYPDQQPQQPRLREDEVCRGFDYLVQAAIAQEGPQF